jgi:hypothetical protein
MISGNYGYNHNTVKFVDESAAGRNLCLPLSLCTGFSLNQSWGYKIDQSNGNGYFNSKEELDSVTSKTTTYGFGEPRIGDFKYMDLNKDGVINDKDQAPIGYSNIPRMIYGLSLTFQYKGLRPHDVLSGSWKIYHQLPAAGRIRVHHPGYLF